ncbi:nuclease-related domain-containing protein [Nocardia abscessus]|uniref:nuclease-related domain-containing protein n=1 Tax=Nocardia abscessus TaxID=120957 RepID=UPI00245786CE|nr:nuclease-related domain-containing protein [Nocardia abscessus]
MYPRHVPYREFAQQVRRFHRDRLLEAVAATSARIQNDWLRGVRRRESDPVGHFTLAAIARTALAEAMVFRADEPVADRHVETLCELVIEGEPELPDEQVLFSPAFRRLMTRMMYQQDFFRHSDVEDVTRTLALLVEHDPQVRGLPTAEQWETVLGVPLPVYLDIVFSLYVHANVRGGRLTYADLDECAAAGALGGVDAATARKVIDTHLAADVNTLRNTAKQDLAVPNARGRELWVSNPLLGTPMVSLKEGYLVPISPYLLHKITPLGMYFIGLGHFGNDFPRALGDSFEKLVGRHLALLEPCGATVYSEITYDRGQNKTVDYVLVFPELVLLVETKGMRSTVQARIGDDTGLQKLAERVQQARDQIDHTADLIGRRIPELAHIPSNRPLRGLVVTMEPIQHIDTALFTDLFTPSTVESATVSAHDFEQVLATLVQQSEVGQRLLDALTFSEPTPPGLDRAIKGCTRERNPLSADLWNRRVAVVPR